MAVKRVERPTTGTDEAKVDVTVDVDTMESTTPEVDVEETVEDTVDVQTPEVEIEEPKKEEPKVEVDTENTKVDTSKKPEGTVKIRMRVDHKCCIAMERYDLKEGKTYIVPENVKRILNKAGLLAPL